MGIAARCGAWLGRRDLAGHEPGVEGGEAVADLGEGFSGEPNDRGAHSVRERAAVELGLDFEDQQLDDRRELLGEGLDHGLTLPGIEEFVKQKMG